jgi:hypothetical protein
MKSNQKMNIPEKFSIKKKSNDEKSGEDETVSRTLLLAS